MGAFFNKLMYIAFSQLLPCPVISVQTVWLGKRLQVVTIERWKPSSGMLGKCRVSSLLQGVIAARAPYSPGLMHKGAAEARFRHRHLLGIEGVSRRTTSITSSIWRTAMLSSTGRPRRRSIPYWYCERPKVRGRHLCCDSADDLMADSRTWRMKR